MPEPELDAKLETTDADALNDTFEPNIVAYCCHYCGYSAADFAGEQRIEYPTAIKIIELPCTGKLDSLHILRALEEGIDGVVVVGCLEDNCNFQIGNKRAKKRVQYIKSQIKEIGLELERVEFYNISLIWGSRFAKLMQEITDRIKTLGPNPLKAMNIIKTDETMISLRADVGSRLLIKQKSRS